MGMRSPEPSLHSRHDPHHIFAAKPGASPKIPAPRITGEISNFNIAMRGGFLRSAFPTGYGHCRGFEFVSEVSLI